MTAATLRAGYERAGWLCAKAIHSVSRSKNGSFSKAILSIPTRYGTRRTELKSINKSESWTYGFYSSRSWHRSCFYSQSRRGHFDGIGLTIKNSFCENSKGSSVCESVSKIPAIDEEYYD